MTGMSRNLLEKDTDLALPSFTVLKASAGSGKTYALTARFVQFLLSETIPRNKLGNILAITFSNNASKEMKERVLLWLKSLCLGDEDVVAEISGIVDSSREVLVGRAREAIDEIISHYADFQVRTIDSFMATLFKTSALDFGYTADFEILMDPAALMEYAFNLFLRRVRTGSAEAELLGRIVRIIEEHQQEGSPYLWDPSANLLQEMRKLYRKLASSGEEPVTEERGDWEREVREGLRESLERLERLISASGLERSGSSAYPGILAAVRSGKLTDLIGKGLKSNPVRKPKKNGGGAQDRYDAIGEEWKRVGQWVNDYVACYARSYFLPYLDLFTAFSRCIEGVKRQQGKVFIEDINRKLGEVLDEKMIPEIYFRLGETIFHYFIDEFQDTSPIQWKNLLPLLENSLSQGGSVFVVGDAKQAIYGFRDADYTIMRECETRNPFAAASHRVLELAVSYRSLPKILEFSEKVFKEAASSHETYREPAAKSGLNDYVQRSSRSAPPGYVEVQLFDKDDEDPPEKRRIQELVQELILRGYRYRDVAILTGRNEDVVKATSWLNEKDIPFVSHSSLDVRGRKATGEILSLLSFLDSPPDDHSFAAFILGDLFGRALETHPGDGSRRKMEAFLFRNRTRRPLYKAFQEEFGDLWERYFSDLFRSSGYRPLYDLVTEAFSIFEAFERMGEEEATFAKILERIKTFEGTGCNNLRDFVRQAAGEEGSTKEWNIDVPRDMDSVKVMTVHKAKGLGFPVVIAVLYGERSRGFDYLIERQDEAIRLLKVNREIAACGPLFERLYHEETVKERVARLNSLYVEFTRAGEELYVFGVKGRHDVFPFALLPAGDYPPAEKPVRPQAAVAESPEAPLALRHASNRLPVVRDPGKKMPAGEQWRGDFIHRVFFHITESAGSPEMVFAGAFKKAVEEMRAEYDEGEIKEVVLGALAHESLKEFFEKKPEREIRNEQEISDAHGRLFRLDRLVLDEHQATVIDYKTGTDGSGLREDETQIRNYMKLLREVYPEKTVEGRLVYVDVKNVRRVV